MNIIMIIIILIINNANNINDNNKNIANRNNNDSRFDVACSNDSATIFFFYTYIRYNANIYIASPKKYSNESEWIN